MKSGDLIRVQPHDAHPELFVGQIHQITEILTGELDGFIRCGAPPGFIFALDGVCPVSDSTDSENVTRHGVDRSIKNNRSAVKSAGESSDSTHSVKVWQKTYEYVSHRCRYYRYIWGIGHKVMGLAHIPGGNAESPIAKSNRARVEYAIAKGTPPPEILQLIKEKLW
jgi:hypothetical protein